MPKNPVSRVPKRPPTSDRPERQPEPESTEPGRVKEVHFETKRVPAHSITEVHPLAECFGPIDEGQVDRLCCSIAEEQGQLIPVVTVDGQLVDGRNRVRACQKLGIDVLVKEYPAGTPVLPLILSLNGRTRRSQNQSQLAMTAARIVNRKPGRTALNSSYELFTQEQVARWLGVSTPMIRKALKLIRSGRSDLIAQVDKGELFLDRAVPMLKSIPQSDSSGTGSGGTGELGLDTTDTAISSTVAEAGPVMSSHEVDEDLKPIDQNEDVNAEEVDDDDIKMAGDDDEAEEADDDEAEEADDDDIKMAGDDEEAEEAEEADDDDIKMAGDDDEAEEAEEADDDDIKMAGDDDEAEEADDDDIIDTEDEPDLPGPFSGIASKAAMTDLSTWIIALNATESVQLALMAMNQLACLIWEPESLSTVHEALVVLLRHTDWAIDRSIENTPALRSTLSLEASLSGKAIDEQYAPLLAKLGIKRHEFYLPQPTGPLQAYLKSCSLCDPSARSQSSLSSDKTASNEQPRADMPKRRYECRIDPESGFELADDEDL